MLDDPDVFVTEVCRRCGLEAGRYPFDRIDTIEVRGSSTLAGETLLEAGYCTNMDWVSAGQ